MINLLKYHQKKNLSHVSVQKFIDEFEEEMKYMSGKCIDIGCGDGDITRHIILPALGPKAVVIGTDILENMITRVKKMCSNEERLKFEVLDIQTKSLPEKFVSEYDHAFTFHTLNWCDDIKQAAENIYRLLRPGGSLLAITVVSHDVFDILHNMSQDNRYKSYVKHTMNFLPPFSDSVQPHKEMKMLLKSVGFNVLHCSHRERTYSTEDVEKLSTLVLSFATHCLRNMPHDLMEQFKNEFAQEYTKRRFSHKRVRCQNGRIAADLHEILVVYARKDCDIQNYS